MLQAGYEKLEDYIYVMVQKVWKEEIIATRWKESLICPKHKKGKSQKL